MFERILIAFDGTPESRRASQVALELASKFDSTLTVATVTVSDGAPAATELAQLVPVDAEGKTVPMLIEELSASAKSKGIRSLEPVYLRGEAATAILEFLKKHPHDLLVAGSRGLSRGRRLLLGSVSAGLVNDSPCPVLVVRGAVPTSRGTGTRTRATGPAAH